MQAHPAAVHTADWTHRAHVWTFAPSDSAYSRAVCRAIMAAIMRLSNIAMAYVHINCGEWRRLLHHVAPCSLQNVFRSSHKARETTQQLDHCICKACRFFSTMLLSKKKKGKNTKGLLRQESRKPALEGEDYAGST